MYMIEDMIDMGLGKDGKWTSKIHRLVAVNSCICNPRVKTMDTLSVNCEIINKIPKSKIKKITFAALVKLGCKGLGVFE